MRLGIFAKTFARPRLEEVFARCARCGGTQFAPAVAGTALRMTSALLCGSCTFSVKHGELLNQLASQAIQHSRAMLALRKRPKAPPQTGPHFQMSRWDRSGERQAPSAVRP